LALHSQSSALGLKVPDKALALHSQSSARGFNTLEAALALHSHLSARGTKLPGFRTAHPSRPAATNFNVVIIRFYAQLEANPFAVLASFQHGLTDFDPEYLTAH
jgi:hypothetical protein